MAKMTSIALRNQVIYQVFPRQYSKTHDLKGITKDLKRIKELGVDVIQLLPIHPIGVVARKGSVGSPYSIKNYMEIDSNYGTEEDLKTLIDTAHALGLRVIMDMVFNHTSKDSYLTELHPEWFYHKPNGDFANRVGDWSDITDLRFDYPELTEYLTEVLLHYVRLGIDGYRFDVATLIPYDFFAHAFPLLRKENPEILLIAESVHTSFCKFIRDMGYEASSDAELFQLFDALYEYDSYDYLFQYMKKKRSIDSYLEYVSLQEASFPKNYVKLRYLENHDFGTANSYLQDDLRLKNLLALSYFCKGMTFLFNGIESLSRHLPNLFEIDEIDWKNYNKEGIVDFITKMNTFKKNKVFALGVWDYKKITDKLVVLSLKTKEEEAYAIVNLDHETGTYPVDFQGKFIDIMTKKEIEIEENITVTEEPIILYRK